MQKIALPTLIFTTAFYGSVLHAGAMGTTIAPMWNGFYGGINLGGAFSSSDPLLIKAHNVQYCPNTMGCSQGLAYATAAVTGTKNKSSLANAGFIGGGQLGFNQTLQSHYVVGFEADIQGISESNRKKWSASAVNFNDNNGDPQIINTNTAIVQGTDFLGTVRGHLGYLINPAFLLSGTGGFAYGGVRSQTRIIQSYGIPQNTNNLDANWRSVGYYANTRLGWTVGGSFAWMPRPAWSAKIEYLYYNLGSVTYKDGNLINNFITPYGPPYYFNNAVSSTTRFDGHVVRVGVNYHFI